MNGDGVISNGDRLYFLDDGTVGGAGTGGLYVSTWNDGNTNNPWNTPNNAAAVAAGIIDHWSIPVRLGDAPIQTGSGGVGQLRGLTGTVISPTEVDLYTTAFDNAAGDNSYVQKWVDTNTGVSIASASESGTTVHHHHADPERLHQRRGRRGRRRRRQQRGRGPHLRLQRRLDDHRRRFDALHLHGHQHRRQQPGDGHQPGRGGRHRQRRQHDRARSPDGTITIGGNGTYAAVGLRGVAFAPVARDERHPDRQRPANSATVSPGTQVTFDRHADQRRGRRRRPGRHTVTFIDQNTNTVLGRRRSAPAAWRRSPRADAAAGRQPHRPGLLRRRRRRRPGLGPLQHHPGERGRQHGLDARASPPTWPRPPSAGR